MDKELIRSIDEYREWAWGIFEKNKTSRYIQSIENQLGLEIQHECYDTNENGEDLDEDGNVIPEDTVSTVNLVEWVIDLKFPVIAVSWIESCLDRYGDATIVAIDFVSRDEFK